jgi:hypothetical protein
MIEVKKPEAKAIKYPVARKYKLDEDGIVVIFWSEKLGTLVSAGGTGAPMEFTAERWAPCTDEAIWKPVDLKISG